AVEPLPERRRLRPDARHHRHRHGSRARAREPVQPELARPRDLDRVHRHVLRRRLGEPLLPADRQQAEEDLPRGGPRADDDHRGHRLHPGRRQPARGGGEAEDVPRSLRAQRLREREGRRRPRRPGPGGVAQDPASVAKKKHHAEHPDERWLLTYADMITLLMALFMVMFAMSEVSKTKFQILKVTLHQTFSSAVFDGGSSILDRGAMKSSQTLPNSELTGQDSPQIGEQPVSHSQTPGTKTENGTSAAAHQAALTAA